MAETMTERVALVFARHNAAGRQWPVGDADRNAARAAIEAMREPTAAQLNTYCDPRNDAMKAAVSAEWRAMIDAALAERSEAAQQPVSPLG